MEFRPHDYQKRAIRKVLELPAVGLFMEMGLGKSVIALSAARILLRDELDVTRVLVIAPLKVAEDTWSRECEKWDHLRDLTISKILGDAKTRKRAAEADADIYVINRENVSWLVKTYGPRWRWDMLIIDELSSFKNNQTERFKSLRRIRPKVKRVVGLTGTPNPNGLMDLWSQVFLLDQGERLEKTIGRYRALYFKPGKGDGHVVYEWVPLKGAQEAITKKLSDITVSMRAEDYLKLPERIENEIRVELPVEALWKYKQLERAKLLELSGTTVTAANAAAVMGKLLQMAGGAVYIEIHDEKIKALKDIVDTSTGPVLVFYGYRHERERLFKAFKSYAPRELKTDADISDWNAGKIPVLLAHPASVGYGLNLQAGGHVIVWYSIPWSLELYQQANARLYRQGQTEAVVINHLIATGTVDENVMASLAAKNTGQAALMNALKERLEG